MAAPAPRPSTARLSRAVLAGGAGVAALAVLAAPGAQATVAIPPGVSVVDEAGVLSPAEERQLSQDITRLRTQAGQNLYVVYVPQHPGGIQGIAADIRDSRGLSPNDNILAIEVENRQYGLNLNQRLDSAEDAVDSAYVNPMLLQAPQNGDWLAPAVAAVEGIDDAADGRVDGVGRSGERYDPAGTLPNTSAGSSDSSAGSGAGGALTGALAAAAVATAVGAGVAVARRRKKDAGRSGGAPASAGAAGPRGGGEPARRDPLDEMSVEQLRTKAGSQLVAADDAIRSSEQEMGFAMAAYGDDAVRTFREDIDKAKEHMRASFQLQNQLDDEIPDTEQDQRSWLKEIIARTGEVSAALSAHQEEFNRLRDLENSVPEALSRIDERLPAAEESVRRAEQTLVDLHASYAESALAQVQDNAAQARERLEFVRTAEDKARSAWESGDRSTAALAVRAAEESLTQVDTLAAAVDKARDSLAATLENVRVGVGQSQQDVAEAEAVLASGRSPELAGPVAGMKQTLASVQAALQSGRPDPRELLHRLETAHRTLNTPLGGVRDAREQARQAEQMLSAALSQASAQIDGTADFIGARRGAVGSEARTRLAEADRMLQTALSLRGSDPVAALEHAQRAGELAERAGELAQRDVAGFGFGGGDAWGGGFGGHAPRGYRRSGAGSGFAGGLGGALLGGILMNSMFNSGGHGGDSWGGGGFGGFGGGGLGGGDFGDLGDFSGGGF
ncbi:TPM domain-containing protein [Micrococcus sp.]|uniref:TPM domain-containing protein n=1 Tax=Micrococcus sp. TaxID=1271 RepID=UPI002A91F2FD|nr:TPM domain-containing protein [Micrococcus sp.]MDY6055880.1 TPM domain-containing protein [Micrococcus sp.]